MMGMQTNVGRQWCVTRLNTKYTDINDRLYLLENVLSTILRALRNGAVNGNAASVYFGFNSLFVRK